MKNFPFEKDGRTYWYSRAVVCVSAVFCKDADGNVYILANQRGTATDKEVGKWNIPVGFLDFDETTQQCAAREIFEETGVRIEPERLKLQSINSMPDGGSQDIGFRYYTVLRGTVDDYLVDTRHQEKNEVVAAKWIDTRRLNDYEWAWNHLDLINRIKAMLDRNGGFVNGFVETLSDRNQFVAKQVRDIADRLKEVYGETLPRELNDQLDYIVSQTYQATFKYLVK